MAKQQTAPFDDEITRVSRAKFGKEPPAACDGACCATNPPPALRESGVAPRAQTIQGLGSKLSPPFGTPANDNAARIERVTTQRERVVGLATELIAAIDVWKRARDAEYRAAIYGQRSRRLELERATRDADARVMELEAECEAAESVLAILERAR